MQEEIENKTINLVISTGRLTSRAIVVGVRAYLEHHRKAKRTKAEEIPHGKQSVKQLIGQNQGVSTIEIADRDVKLFQQIAKKYGVDFAVQRDGSSISSRYLIFFKARDADALDAIMKEYTSHSLMNKGRSSIRLKLARFKALVASMPKKERSLKREKSL